MYYNKQIIYIDYMEAGSKVKNAGFLRKEETEDTITWNMQIKGLYETDTGFFDLRDETGALIDKVLLKRGTGSYERQFTAGGVSRGGREFGEICGITIRLSPGREVIGRWKGREECLKAADISVAEEKRRKYAPPLAGMAQYERLQEEAPNVMPEIDLPQAEQRTRGISFSEMPEAVTYQAEPRTQGLSFTEMQKAALHPADQPEILQYQNPLTEKQKNTESAEERSGFQINRDAVDSVMENGSISAEKLCRRCMHKRFTPQEKNGNRNQKKRRRQQKVETSGKVEFKKKGCTAREGYPAKKG